MINGLKLHNTVEYIKQYPFEYEIIEVEENLKEILLNYGIEDNFTEEEIAMLNEELSKLAEQFEFNEAAYIALKDEGFDF